MSVENPAGDGMFGEISGPPAHSGSAGRLFFHARERDFTSIKIQYFTYSTSMPLYSVTLHARAWPAPVCLLQLQLPQTPITHSTSSPAHHNVLTRHGQSRSMLAHSHSHSHSSPACLSPLPLPLPLLSRACMHFDPALSHPVSPPSFASTLSPSQAHACTQLRDRTHPSPTRCRPSFHPSAFRPRGFSQRIKGTLHRLHSPLLARRLERLLCLLPKGVVPDDELLQLGPSRPIQ